MVNRLSISFDGVRSIARYLLTRGEGDGGTDDERCRERPLDPHVLVLAPQRVQYLGLQTTKCKASNKGCLSSGRLERTAADIDSLHPQLDRPAFQGSLAVAVLAVDQGRRHDG